MRLASIRVGDVIDHSGVVGVCGGPQRARRKPASSGAEGRAITSGGLAEGRNTCGGDASLADALPLCAAEIAKNTACMQHQKKFQGRPAWDAGSFWM